MNVATCFAFCALHALAGTALSAMQQKEIVAQGKKATAFVELVAGENTSTGSAFCVDKSGLFITNAHVIRLPLGVKGEIRLSIDVGKENRVMSKASVYRRDDRLDLALLKIEPIDGLTALELSREDGLIETSPILIFGYPLGDLRVNSYKITALRRDVGGLPYVEFDGQLNEGASGGPILDETGRVVGVATATVPGRDINLAISAGTLGDFMKAPGVRLELPPLAYNDRSQDSALEIRLLPPTPGAAQPEGMRVELKVFNDLEDPRTFKAVADKENVFKATIVPVSREAERRFDLECEFPDRPHTTVRVNDRQVRVGDRIFMLGDLRILIGGSSPRVHTTSGAIVSGKISGLGSAETVVDKKVTMIDLTKAIGIEVDSLQPPPPAQGFAVAVQVYRESKLTATVVNEAKLEGAPQRLYRRARIDGEIVLVPVDIPPPFNVTPGDGPSDADFLEVADALKPSGGPRGLGREIRPPKAEMGAAALAADSPDSRSPKEVMKYLGLNGDFGGLALSPDGRRILSGSSDGSIHLWDLASGKQEKVLSGHNGRIMKLAFSPDGKNAWSGGADRRLRLWDLSTGQLIRTFPDHGDWILGLGFTPDGKRVFSAGGGRLEPGWREGTDFDVRVWDVDAGTLIARWPGHKGMVFKLVVSPDGRRVLTTSTDGSARLWEADTGKLLRQFPMRREVGTDGAFTPDGNRILLTYGEIVRILDAANGRELSVLRGHSTKLDTLDVSRDGKTLLASSWGGKSFRVWSLPEGKEIAHGELPGNVSTALFTGDGREILCGFTGGTVSRFSLPAPMAPRRNPAVEPPQQPLVAKISGTISDLATGGGGRYLILTLKDTRKLVVFDVNAADIVKEIALASDDALTTAGAKSLFIAYPKEKLIERWDLEDLSRQGERLPSPIKATLTNLALGSDSNGPMLAAWRPDPKGNELQSTRYSFVDPDTLKVLSFGRILADGLGAVNASSSHGSFVLFGSNRKLGHVRASGEGNLFGLWNTEGSPAGVQTLSIRGDGTLLSFYEHNGLNHLAPDPAGTRIYTGLGEALNVEGKALRRPDPRPPFPATAPTIPSSDPAHYLCVRGLRDMRFGNQQPASITASIHAAEDGSSLFTLTGLDEMKDLNVDESSTQTDFTLEKRFHLVPAAQLLITIPTTNDRLVLRRVDIEKTLEDIGYQSLIVATPTDLHVEAGGVLHHQIEARSPGKGLRYELEKGPQGLTLSSTGAVDWALPNDLPNDVEELVVKMSDSSGRKRSYPIKIHIR